MVTILFALLLQLAIRAICSYNVIVNISQVSNIKLWNVWKGEITWDYHGDWMDSTAPPNRVKSNYPFLDRIELFTATGGCYKGYPGCTSNRDLLTDPSDINSTYNFSDLGVAINNILTQNLTPYIVTGNIPIAYSIKPVKIGKFGVNSSPPLDYDKYSDYITNLAQYLINTFGKNKVSQFYWGVFTEYNNYDWFEDNANKNDTENDYFKVYDYTSCGLQKAFGNNAFKIGAHGCNQCGNGWSTYDLLKHISNETNYCTSKKGDIPLNFYSVSFYEKQPGNPGNLTDFKDVVCSMSDAIKSNGLDLKQIELGIDEGRILNGPYGLPIAARAVGDTYQASFDSLLFVNMIRCNISWYSRWDVCTNGNLLSEYKNVIDPVSTNVARLTYKMRDNMMVNMNINGGNNGNKQIVDGMAVVATNLVQIYVFNHVVNATSNTIAQIDKLMLCGLGLKEMQLNVTEWMIDDDHSQFWTVFWNDVITHNLTGFCPNWSNHSETISFCDNNDAQYFESRVSIYQQAAKLKYVNFRVDYDADNPEQCVSIVDNYIIPHHGVRLFEIQYNNT